jgi:chaperone required for assembly of F1-ATPase
VNRKGSKRFYKQVEVTGNGLFGIALDGRPLKTPLKRNLSLPTEALAEAIAAEWAAQGDRIHRDQMPITKLANTAIDRVTGDEERIVGELVDYANSDLVCYRAAEPESLVTRQGEYWDPILGWAEETLKTRFAVIQGVVHKHQSGQALDAVACYLEQFNPMQLSALYNLATLTGSALMALAIESGSLEAERAWLAANVDEDWQGERWGKDEEAAEQRARRKLEFDAAVKFLSLLGRQRPPTGLTP